MRDALPPCAPLSTGGLFLLLSASSAAAACRSAARLLAWLSLCSDAAKCYNTHVMIYIAWPEPSRSGGLLLVLGVDPLEALHQSIP